MDWNAVHANLVTLCPRFSRVRSTVSSPAPLSTEGLHTVAVKVPLPLLRQWTIARPPEDHQHSQQKYRGWLGD